MHTTSADEPGREARLDQLIAAYLEAVEDGCAPARETWFAQHADLADDLRAFLANHDRMAQSGAAACTGASRGYGLPGADPATK